MIPNFAFARLPKIQFGAGSLSELPREARLFGSKALLITGQREISKALRAGFAAEGLSIDHVRHSGEPTPDQVDALVSAYAHKGHDLVIGLGGGSVLDLAKAVAGLLPFGNSIMDHLEGVGKGVPYEGPGVPLIAVPTTAGTGSEMTKNAVVGLTGAGGFKKSFRHDSLMARVAIVDPDFLATCPRPLMAANAMDAFTQVLESYVSSGATPLTDALAWQGMETFMKGFLPALDGEESGYAALSYSAMLSGITLAHTGLGAVHGIASPLGAVSGVAHGVACGTLLAETTDVNILALSDRDPDHPTLDKYAMVGELLAGRPFDGVEEALAALVGTLRRWAARLELPKLSDCGVAEADLATIVAGSRGNSMKTNPIILSDEELMDILTRRF